MDIKFEKDDDPRVEGKVTYKLSNMLIALVVSVVTDARSLRKVETRTGQISKKNKKWLGIEKRIADNIFSKVLQGILVVSRLRIAAIAILSIARYFCRFEYTKEKPTWDQIKEHYLLTLCASSLLTEDFDAI